MSGVFTFDTNIYSRIRTNIFSLEFYTHWEYHSLVTTQVVPSTQVPLPDHPVPPHCAYFCKVPPGAEVGVGVDSGVVEVTSVVPGSGALVDVGEEGGSLTTTPPGPATEVVRDPLSM